MAYTIRDNFRPVILTIIIFALGLRFAYGQYQDENQGDADAQQEQAESSSSSKELVKVNNKICPVDFKILYSLEDHSARESFQYAYEGKVYNLDSALCVEEFKKDPEKYLKMWQKKERFRRINIIND